MLAAACGGGGGLASPTTTPAADRAEAPAAAARPLPAGLEAAYVLTLSSATPDGRPKVWAGGPFHHCIGGGIDAQALRPVLDQMSALSGIPETTAGACNVEWVIDPDLPPTENAHSVLQGTATAILHARVVFGPPADYVVRYSALHESGHVLGLSHSPVATDAMAPAGQHPFSAAELAVLAWMYGR